MEELLGVASALGTADRAGRDACLSTRRTTSEPLDDVTGDLSGWPEGSEQLTVIRQALAGMASAGTEAEAIDRIRVLESLKSTCAALQAREAVSLDVLRRAREAVEGVPADQRGRGVGGEVALARREPAQRGGRHIGLARALCHEMPNILRALTDGEISEEHATAMARETAWLPVEHRRAVDALMSCRLGPIGVKKLAAEARAHAQRLDQESAVAHLERCTAERRVSVRPATGGMAYLTALLPMPQAVAVFANLHRDASTAVGVGDTAGRTRDQIMADLLVERTTGQHSAPAIPTEIHLVMTDATLLAGDPTSGWLPGQGPIPAEQARQMATDPEAEVFLRRLFTAPESGLLVSMDSKARVFPPLLRRMLVLRDDVCRTPWCEAPIRHADHAKSHRDGGQTSYANGSGLCARCNYTKEHAGWCHEATPDGLDVITPTGHRYENRTSPLPSRMYRSRHERSVSSDAPEARAAAVMSGWNTARTLARLSMAAALAGPDHRLELRGISPRYLLRSPFFVEDVGVLAGRPRHDCCPQSLMIRGGDVTGA
ncbi:HNH endonuclease [Citricoccus zhacaiensis]